MTAAAAKTRKPPAVPAAVEEAARVVYLRPPGDPARAASEPVVLAWVRGRWPREQFPTAPECPEVAAFWVLSAAFGGEE